MELRQLEYLLAVIETASFSAAARKLGVTQPSVSEQIRNLEKSVHQPLLDRLPGRVIPTAVGRQLAEHARRILAEVADASRHAHDALDEVTGPLTVGAIPTIAPFIFPRVFRPFQSRFPKVELSLVEETTPVLLERLANGEIDLAIASTVPPTQHLHIETIAHERLLLMLPAQHRLARMKSIDAEMLDQEKFVALHEMHCLADQSAKFCLRTGLRQLTIMHGSNLFTLSRMVATGAGITLVPAMMVDARPRGAPGCAFRRFRKNAPTRPLTLIWSLLRYRAQNARRFAGMVEPLLRKK